MYYVTLSSPPFEGGIMMPGLTIFLDIVIVRLFHGVFSYSQWHARSDSGKLHKRILLTSTTALHTDLRSEMERMTFSPSPRDMRQESKRAAVLLAKKEIPSHRMKQIRVLVSVYGTLRLPPHKVSNRYAIVRQR